VVAVLVPSTAPFGRHIGGSCGRLPFWSGPLTLYGVVVDFICSTPLYVAVLSVH